MAQDDDEERSKSLKEKINLSVDIPPVPIARDGGIVPGYGLSAPDPDPGEAICEQGPCRYYWRMITSADAGNPAGTFEALGVAEPRRIVGTCLTHVGVETELSRDAPVYSCSRWDPMTSSELSELERRRELYQIRRRAAAPVETVPPDLELE